MIDFERNNIVFEPDGKPKGTIVRGNPAPEDREMVARIDAFLGQFSSNDITDAISAGISQRESDLDYQQWFEDTTGGKTP